MPSVRLKLFSVVSILFAHFVFPGADRNEVTASEVKPNVILILADDMAIGDFGCLNENRSQTPHLDRLKQESVWFKNAYSAAPVCGPARASLLTGRYPHRTGVVTLNQLKYPKLTQLKQDETTLANVFQDNGYATGLVGKWHCGTGEPYGPLARGFDEFAGFANHLHVPSYFDYQLTVQRETTACSQKYLTNDLSTRAIDFVRRHQEHPFFLHLAHYAPHRPLGAPEDRIKPFLQRGLDRDTATVYAMIEIMDEGIGDLMSELDKLRLRDKTIVIFASDNGPDPLVESRFNHNRRGTKYTVYEGGIHVPFFIHWHGTLDASQREELIHFVDLFPTIIDMCRLKTKTKLPLDGRSFAGPLTGRTAVLRPRPLFWQWNRKTPIYSHNAAMREGDWKLIRPYVTRGIPKGPSKRTPELYQISSDPAETRNVASEHPERVSRMNKALSLWSKSVEHDRNRPDAPSRFPATGQK